MNSSYDTYSPIISDEPDVATATLELPENGEIGESGKRRGKNRVVNNATQGGMASLKRHFAAIHDFFTGTPFRWSLAILLILFATYLAISFISYISGCVADFSEIQKSAIGTGAVIENRGGEGGARLSKLLINDCFGIASFVIIFWLAVIGLKLLGVGLKFKTLNFTIKCLVALVGVSLIVGLLTISADMPVNWGGLHGRHINEFLVYFMGWSGAVLVAVFVIALFCIMCLRDVAKWLLRLRREFLEKRAAAKAEKEEELERELRMQEMSEREHLEEAHNEDAVDESNTLIYTTEDAEPDKEAMVGEATTMEFVKSLQPYEINDIEEEESSKTQEGETPSSDSQTAQDGPKPLKVKVGSISDKVHGKYPLPEGIPGSKPYKFPPYDLMLAEETQIYIDPEEQRENEEKIRSTLASFGINIISIEATVGPTVTLYEIMLDTGIKISKVRSLADEIAMALAASASVRIIAPIPGRNTVGIEVGNRNPVTVSMRTIIKSPAFQKVAFGAKKYQLPLALGSTISNEVYVADLAEMPHLLVAGATGQGKSVGLNAIVASLLYSKTPDEMKFVIVDPKFVEFSFYSQIESHYLAKLPGDGNPIISEMSQVAPVLSSLCIEMDNRYQLLRDAGCRKIKEYNAKIMNGDLNPEEGHKYMPFIVVIMDEFSDLMSQCGKEVERPVVRLAQKARAVGMHIIIATQRPSTDVITGIIKANFPARIAFKVMTGVDSKTILNSTSAYQLVGRGDMLVSHKSELVRVQCAFIDTPEVEAICQYIARQPYPRGAYILPEPAVTGDDDGPKWQGSASDRDVYFEQAARDVVMVGTASTSSLQRRYSIGYVRAGKIMDQLEAAGIVGPASDGKARSVLVDQAELERILKA